MSRLTDVCLIVEATSKKPIIITTGDQVKNGLYINSFSAEEWHLDFRYWFIQSNSNYDIQIIETVESSETWVEEFYTELFGCWGFFLINSKNSIHKFVPYAKKVSQFIDQFISGKEHEFNLDGFRTGWIQDYPLIHLLRNSSRELTSSESAKKRFISCLIEVIKLKVHLGFSNELIQMSYDDSEHVCKTLLKTTYSKTFFSVMKLKLEISIDNLRLLDASAFKYLLHNSREILLCLEMELEGYFTQPLDLHYGYYIFFLKYKRCMVTRLDRLPEFTQFVSYIFDLYGLETLKDLDNHIYDKTKNLQSSHSVLKNFWITYHWFVKHVVHSVNPEVQFRKVGGKERWMKFSKDEYVEFYFHLNGMGIIHLNQIQGIRNRY